MLDVLVNKLSIYLNIDFVHWKRILNLKPTLQTTTTVYVNIVNQADNQKRVPVYFKSSPTRFILNLLFDGGHLIFTDTFGIVLLTSYSDMVLSLFSQCYLTDWKQLKRVFHVFQMLIAICEYNKVDSFNGLSQKSGQTKLLNRFSITRQTFSSVETGEKWYHHAYLCWRKAKMTFVRWRWVKMILQMYGQL